MLHSGLRAKKQRQRGELDDVAKKALFEKGQIGRDAKDQGSRIAGVGAKP